jgi:hypothetical protein
VVALIGTSSAECPTSTASSTERSSDNGSYTELADLLLQAEADYRQQHGHITYLGAWFLQESRRGAYWGLRNL